MKYLYIQPRQIGKTTLAIYEYLKNPKESLLIFCNNDMVNNVKKKLVLNGHNDTNNIITQNQIITKIRGKRYKNLILDEYFFFTKKNKREIYENLYLMDLENVIAYTTSDKLYSSVIIDYIRLEKHNYSYTELFNLFIEKHPSYINEFIKSGIDFKENFNDLYYNFLTDKDFIIMDKSIRLGGNINKNNMKKILNPKEYQIEIENNFII